MPQLGVTTRRTRDARRAQRIDHLAGHRHRPAAVDEISIGAKTDDHIRVAALGLRVPKVCLPVASLRIRIDRERTGANGIEMEQPVGIRDGAPRSAGHPRTYTPVRRGRVCRRCPAFPRRA